MEKTLILKWARRLLGMLAGLIVAGVLLAGAVLTVLDSDKGKQLLVWGADKYLDACLQINGEFSIALGRETTLIAKRVLLEAHDGSYSVSAGKVRLRQRLGSYLLTGTLWINALELSDIRISMQQDAAPGFEPDDMTLPPVLIEQAGFHNLSVRYQQADGKTLELVMLDLLIDDVNNTGPVAIRGKGRINEQPLNVEGSLGPLATLFSADPYPVSLDVTSGSLAAHISGSVAEPITGKGLDLSLSLNDPKLSQTLRLFDTAAPEIGALSARARLYGDYDAPGLDDIDMQLQRDPDLDISVSGKVGNLVTGAGLALVINARCTDTALLSRLAAIERERVEALTTSGLVHEKNGRFLLSDVSAEMKTGHGLEIRISGSTTLPTRHHPRPAKSQALQVRFTAPSLEAVDFMVPGDIPELGRITGSTAYRPYRDGARLSDIHVEAADGERLKATLTGSIDFVPYTQERGLTGADLRIDLNVADSADFGRLIDRELPELGSVSLQMWVAGGPNNVTLDRISLTAGPRDRPAIQASGTARLNRKRHTGTLQLGFGIAVADIVAAMTKTTPDYLGRLQGKLSASGIDGSWGLDRFDVESTQTSLYKVRFSGAVDDILTRDKGTIHLDLDIPDPAALGKALDINVVGLADYHTEGVLTLDNKQLSYRGAGVLGGTRSTTQLSGSLAGDRPALKGRFNIPLLYLADFGLEPAPAPEVRQREHSEKKSRTPAQHLFSREPLNFAWLDKLNLDLDIAINQIDNWQVSAGQLHGRIVLQDGLLQVRPMKLVAAGGPTDFELGIDARNTPVITLKVSANDQKLGGWLAQIQKEIPVDGYASYEIELSGSGHSPHEIVSGLEGSIGLAFEDARIPSEYVEYLSVDVFGWVLSKATGKGTYADINCVLAKFDISEGIMNSALLVSDGPRLSIEGRLKLDLGAETIHAVLLPKQKKMMFSEIAPVKISGNMQDPEIRAIPAKEAVTRIGAMILLPYVAIPVTLLGKLWSSLDDHDAYGGGCARLKAARDAAGEKTPALESAIGTAPGE